MLGAETDQGRTRRKNVVVGRKIRETNRQDIQQFFCILRIVCIVTICLLYTSDAADE